MFSFAYLFSDIGLPKIFRQPVGRKFIPEPFHKMRAFWISAFSFLLGLFFLYRGFYFTDQFYLLDYIFLGDVQTVIESGNKTTYGIPLSLWWLESVLVYCALSIAGLALAYFVERDNTFVEKV